MVGSEADLSFSLSSSDRFFPLSFSLSISDRQVFSRDTW